jgi:alpha-amylase
MPDLNYENPAVRQEIEKITKYWLEDVGVDGFRIDAVRYVLEDEKLSDSESNHRYLEEWGAYYRSINPRAFTVGEVWTGNVTVKRYVNTNTQLDSAFNFDLSTSILKSVKDGNNTTVWFTLQSTVRDFPEQDNANFITNHDMPRAMTEFRLGDNLGKSKSAAGILLTAPGIPFIYYGEEIGMSGTKPDELIRTPMQWDNTPTAGFTSGTPWQAVNTDFTTVNVDSQAGVDDSLLEHYRTLIHLRNEHTALRVGQTYVTNPSSNKLVTYLRASNDEVLLVVINVSDKSVSDYDLDLAIGPLLGSYTAKSLLDDSTINPLTANDRGGFSDYTPLSEIPPYSIFVIQLSNP